MSVAVARALARVAAVRAQAAGLTYVYDRARALESGIGSQFEYRRDIPPLPLGSDAVDHFLFESRIGFCEQVGTSLVVMARSLGIPARLVVGFVPADRESGQWVVRAEHAHAWAEVWFPGIGWQGFDPTASVPLAADDEPPDDGSLLPMVLVLVGAAIVLGGVGDAIIMPWWPATKNLSSAESILFVADGLTIKGAQKVLREKGVKYVASLSPAVAGAEDEVRPDIEDAVIVPMGQRKSDEELGYLIKGLARDMKLAGEVSVEDLAPILARLKRVRDRLAVHEGVF